MKHAFSATLILSLLLETMAAFALISGPGGISAAGQGEQWSMHYGFAALSIASISVWTWPHRTNLSAVTLCLGVLLTFHAAIAISLAIAGDQMFGLISHTILTVACIVLFTQKSSWCSEQNLNGATDE